MTNNNSTQIAEHVSPDGRWKWNGTAWVPNVDQVAARKQRKRSMIALGLCVPIVIAGGVSGILSMKDDTPTVHDLAVQHAEVCYDDTDSSDGTSTPHDQSFYLCLDRTLQASERITRDIGMEVVDENGNPVLYNDLEDAIRADLNSWMTPEWKP